MSENDENDKPVKDEGFWDRNQAAKVREILRFIYSLPAEINESVRKGRPWYSISFGGPTEEKSSQYIKEIQAVAMVVRCFEVGGAFPTQMYKDQANAFPTDLYAPPVEEE